MVSKRKRKLSYIIVGGLVLLLVVVIALKSAGVMGGTPAMEVRYVYPARRNIVQLTTAMGRIQPVVEVKISPEVSGEIIDLPIIEGQRVERGTLLCRIKPDTYVSMREQADAALSSAISRLGQANSRLALQKQNAERAKQLFETNAMPKAEYESALANHKVAIDEAAAARFAVESARASLNEATERLERTTIYSPVQGTISRLNVELGERVVGTAQMAGTELMRLADLDNMEARVNVSEADIANVHLRDTAIVHVDAYPDTTFRGVVTQIASSSNQANSADQITTFEVRILLLAESYKWLREQNGMDPFKPGMSVSVDIMTKRAFDVLSVPIEAIATRKPNPTDDARNPIDPSTSKPKEVLFLAQGDSARMVYVATGIQDTRYIHLTTLLADSARVIVSPYSAVARELEDGTLIHANRESDR